MGRSMVVRGPTGSGPTFIADFRSRDHLLPAPAKLDAAQFPGYSAVRVTVGVGGAAIGAVAVPVGSLAYNIPAGTVLTFTGGKLATLSARALRGAVSLAVNPLAAALAAGNTATHTPSMRAHVEIDDENPVPNGAGGFLYLATLTVREAGAGQ